jgi:uncharacterized paraquat-inducible protein A
MYWIKKYEVKCPECGHIYLVDRKEFAEGIFIDLQESTSACPKCTFRHSLNSSNPLSNRLTLAIVFALLLLILLMVTYLLYTMYFRPS